LAQVAPHRGCGGSVRRAEVDEEETGAHGGLLAGGGALPAPPGGRGARPLRSTSTMFCRLREPGPRRKRPGCCTRGRGAIEGRFAGRKGGDADPSPKSQGWDPPGPQVFDKALERAGRRGMIRHPSHQKLLTSEINESLMIQYHYAKIWASCLTSLAPAALSGGHGWVPGNA